MCNTSPIGKTVALVGPSGSGKTTFVNLALGLLRTERGAIRIDGHLIDEIDMQHIRKRVGVVTQEPILFQGTIAENISHAKESMFIKEVRQAALTANAHNFIMEMPEQYESIVGERGVRLSGGQKQRIAIARAILRKPSILIFDEATSALDSIAEQEVQKGILAVIGRQTTLTIAHRLSTIFHSDIIFVFYEGRIVEKGSHQELIELDGYYARLIKSQFQYIRNFNTSFENDTKLNPPQP